MEKFKRIFFVIIPFVLFGIFRGLLTPFLSDDPEMVRLFALIGIIAFAVLIFSQFIVKNKMYFPAGVSLVFIGYLIISLIIPSESWKITIQSDYLLSIIISKPEFMLYFCLFLTAFIPPLLKIKPFTNYFAQNMIAKPFQETKLYKTVNIIINYYWVVIFGLSALSQFFNSHFFSIIIPVVLQLGFGLFGTKFLIKYLIDKLSHIEQSGSRDYLKSAKDAISGMPFVFNKKAGKNSEMVIQFNITGSETFNGYLEIKSGKCSYFEGKFENPNLIINSPADIWLKVAKNEISGEEGFLKRLYSVEGDSKYLFEMNKIFKPDSPNEEIKYQSLGNSTSDKKVYYKAKPGTIKKILAIQSSPRNPQTSKTDIILTSFLKGCKNAGADYEIIYLKDKKINYCTGCFTCWTKTPGKCVFNDDVAEIIEKEFAADITIMASPLYHFGIYSKLKTYIERTLVVLEPYLIDSYGETSHPRREKYLNKEHYWFIMGVCGFPEVNHFDAFSNHFHTICRSNPMGAPKIIGEIYRPAAEALAIPAYSDESKRVLDACEKAGEELVKNGFVEDRTINEISAIGFDLDLFRQSANSFWDLCIKEGKTLGQMQKEI